MFGNIPPVQDDHYSWSPANTTAVDRGARNTTLVRHLISGEGGETQGSMIHPLIEPLSISKFLRNTVVLQTRYICLLLPYVWKQ